MIQLSEVSLQRGVRLLLSETDLTIHQGWRVGLIGQNGCGKSSLFQLLLRELSLDHGELKAPKVDRIAHMAQEVSALNRTAVDYVVDGDQPLRQLQKELADAEQKGDNHQIAHIHGAIDAIEGYTTDQKASLLLSGLGFSVSDQQRHVSDFSGGWRIRLNLAQALMAPSDLLLLDEPTNHLDLDATFWLEQRLRQYPGTMLLISHDRDFLDRVVDYIVSFENQQLVLYRGNYTSYELQKAERLAQQQALFSKQQRRISEIEQFVSRFRAKATKAKQAQSRLKELQRMEKIAPAHIDSPFSFVFPAADKMSDPLLVIDQADIGYTDKTILNKVDLRLHPGSRIGLLGANGAGKSTLVKALVGSLPLLSGDRVDGEHTSIGYFAQHQLEALDLSASPILHLQRLSPQATEQQLRDFLGGFDFRGDAALATVRDFSGGEKARLALAIIAWQKPNMLLLDEPTNHLDLEMRHALTLAMQSFEGALVVVSHDRHLLKNSVDTFWLVADGSVSEFAGTLDDYQRWLLDYRSQASSQAQIVGGSDGVEGKPLDRKQQRQIAAEMRQRTAPIRKKIKQFEKQLEKLHTQLDECEQRLADTSIYHEQNKDELQRLLESRGAWQVELESIEEQWLILSEELEGLET